MAGRERPQQRSSPARRLQDPSLSMRAGAAASAQRGELPEFEIRPEGGEGSRRVSAFDRITSGEASGSHSWGSFESEAHSRTESLAIEQLRLDAAPGTMETLARVMTVQANRRRAMGGGATDPFPTRSEFEERFKTKALSGLKLVHAEQEYPTASREEIKRLKHLQAMHAGLLEMQALRLRDIKTTRIYPKEMAPHTQWMHEKWIVEGHADAYPITLDCQHREEVHIRMCHGVSGRIPIAITGLVKAFYIENCSNLRITVDACLASSCINRSSGLRLVIGGECPSLELRNVHATEITMAPECMDGTIQSINCSSLSVNCVPRSGYIALSPKELVNARAKYRVDVPSRVMSTPARSKVTSEAQGDADEPNAAEVYWNTRQAAQGCAP
eukprot:CAMPEP_0206239156 /NCGR_PEP_ID=MMETSP0047_2-20121206/15224_1 /ASSEMBLY_ACC=CAM_ASM_000192 /TAXON_ID=195065 /ORGANISM="Chroomonas mesostigmatica_cf, Strain CCMP1168" /LENGTH=385 /DNA_ID=CAMNT_0053663791 /DNA_START=161 /DNA_END=1315 /DNA_ORIENTATION=-